MRPPTDYDQFTSLKPLKMYCGEPCQFPNLVFRGWRENPVTGDKWAVHMCPWSADLFSSLFTDDEWREIKRLRLLYQGGYYDERIAG